VGANGVVGNFQTGADFLIFQAEENGLEDLVLAAGEGIFCRQGRPLRIGKDDTLSGFHALFSLRRKNIGSTTQIHSEERLQQRWNEWTGVLPCPQARETQPIHLIPKKVLQFSSETIDGLALTNLLLMNDYRLHLLDFLHNFLNIFFSNRSSSFVIARPALGFAGRSNLAQGYQWRPSARLLRCARNDGGNLNDYK